MSHTFCPGAKFIRQPKPEIVTCPDCGAEVEIWSDEFSTRCSSCGRVIVQEGMMSCIEWCAMAKECVGESAFESFSKSRAASIKDRLLSVAKETVDQESMQFVERSLNYAEILSQKENADLHIALAGTVLSNAFHTEPERARKELLKLGFQLDDAEEVCRIVEADFQSASIDTVNYSVVHDARLLALREAAGQPEGGYLTATALTLAH
jgi:hypothetical protein